MISFLWAKRNYCYLWTQSDWSQMGDKGVDIILECTGVFASKEKAMAHIESGQKRLSFRPLVLVQILLLSKALTIKN